jgi:AAA+ ATPase superfamily predicted ATPase
MPNRPFDNYRTAIDDPEFFFGRTTLLKYFRQNPGWVHVLLGGQRIGKTSTLRAIEWSMLELPPDRPHSPFPVLINLQTEQPRSADHFRYLLIARLRDALGRYLRTSDQIPWGDWRNAYRKFVETFDEVKIEAYFAKLKLKVPASALNPEDFRAAIQDSIDELRKLGFQGILFLLDEAEFVTRTEWGNDAWSHLRGFKDTDPLKGALGFIISGFRGVLEYQQRVGSPLKNIAQTTWMTGFEREAADQLIARRFAEESEPIRDGDEAFLWEYSGGYPFLLQQLVSTVIDARRGGDPGPEALLRRALIDHNQIFRDWWNVDGKTDGLTERERIVYALMPEDGRVSLDELLTRLEARLIPLLETLQILCGSGLVREVERERYEISSRLFRRWTQSQ